MKKSQEAPTELGPRLPDHAATGIRAFGALVPIIGSTLAEIVTSLIPNQRLDRVEKYLTYLHLNLQKKGVLDEDPRLRNEESINLIEDGAYLAARSISERRLAFIAHCVAEGVSSTQQNIMREKKILGIIGDLDDDDILLLDAMASADREKLDRIRPTPATVGCSDETAEAFFLWEQSFGKLESFSLLSFRPTINRELGYPEHDAFGNRKGYHITTRLGYLVLQRIGLSKIDKQMPE